MRIVKNQHVLLAEPIVERLVAPGPGGEPIEIARPGMWVCYAEGKDGLEFKGFLDEQEMREKHSAI